MGACYTGQRIVLDALLGVISEWVGDERDRRLEHVDLDAPAPAGALALVQRPENAIAGKHPGGVVRNGRAAGLRVVWIEEEARDAAQCEADAVIGRPSAVRPGCAESGDGTVDELGICRSERPRRRSSTGP